MCENEDEDRKRLEMAERFAGRVTASWRCRNSGTQAGIQCLGRRKMKGRRVRRSGGTSATAYPRALAVPPGCLAGPPPPLKPNIIAVPSEGGVEQRLRKPRGIALARGGHGLLACRLRQRGYTDGLKNLDVDVVGATNLLTRGLGRLS